MIPSKQLAHAVCLGRPGGVWHFKYFSVLALYNVVEGSQFPDLVEVSAKLSCNLLIQFRLIGVRYRD